MNSKAKGIRFERVVRKILEEKGCFVIRQAASTFPDLIAFTREEGIVINDERVFGIVAVECKVNGKLQDWEIEYLENLRDKHTFNIFVASSGDTLKHVNFREVQ